MLFDEFKSLAGKHQLPCSNFSIKGAKKYQTNLRSSHLPHTMGKNKQKKGDYWDGDDEMDTTPQEFGTPSQSEEPEAVAESAGPVEPTVASAADDFEEDGFMSALKRSKKKKDDKKEAEVVTKADAGPQVKSKKEKEKEKKEREKAKKKAQAERKKTAPPVVKKTAAASAGAASDAPAGKKDVKSKKESALVAALKKQQASLRAAEEEQRRVEEEEKKLEEEMRRKVEEEEKAKEEARLKKKEKEKAKKEELRAQGKLLTKKQKQEQAALERRRQALLASGVTIEGLSGGDAKPKKVVYGKKKSQKSETPAETTPEVQEPPKKAVSTPAPVEEAEPAASESPVTPEAPEEEDALLDDWEAALDSDGEVKDNWEEMDEPETPEQQPVEEVAKEDVKPKPKPAAKGKKQEEEEEEEGAFEKSIEQSRARQAEIAEKREERHTKALEKASSKNLRSPICCILGHVDTGKTKLLDKVRQTNVQEGEAGGITQQIGATYFPIDAIEQKTKVMNQFVSNINYNVPGLLIIDTPGHESFTNLRSRGSSLCNIAILVVDIMHGLEQQTLESIRLLKDRKTPFVVALNKIDRIYDWESTPNNAFRDSLAKQKTSVQKEFQERLEKTKLAFAEQGLNAEVYYENKNMGKYVSLIPTSAVTGEGVPDLLYLLLELTQSRMSKQLMYLSELEATILEVKVVEGLGTTIDVVLSNGILREGDRIVLCGQNGPIATNVRALLTPQPLRELRIKSAYVHHKEVKAALGVKIAANDLDKAVAGSRLLLCGPDDDEEELMDEVMDDLSGLLDSVDKSGRGVCVQASTLGSLEALLDFLKAMKIPVMAISIGPVYKRDIIRATAMLDKAPEYALMLAFDVKVDKEAEQFAEENGIKIFSADIIYHLFDAFTAYQQKMLEQRKKDMAHEAIYPCVLKTIQVINARNPMIIGVDIVEGSLRIGTPICVVKPDPATGQKIRLNLGRVQSLEVNHKPTEVVKKGGANAGVAMRLDSGNSNPPTWGRHMVESDPLYSAISRRSIDVLKDPAFRNDVPRDDWLLIKHLKPILDIK